jgi:hypothetical protein
MATPPGRAQKPWQGRFARLDHVVLADILDRGAATDLRKKGLAVDEGAVGVGVEKVKFAYPKYCLPMALYKLAWLTPLISNTYQLSLGSASCSRDVRAYRRPSSIARMFGVAFDSREMATASRATTAIPTNG